MGLDGVAPKVMGTLRTIGQVLQSTFTGHGKVPSNFSSLLFSPFLSAHSAAKSALHC